MLFRSGTVADALLAVHRSYLKPLRALDDAKLLKAAAHITGGGITDNTPRVLPKGLAAHVKVGSWPVLPIFEHMKQIGNVPDADWRRTFNLGIGMIFVIGKRDLVDAAKILKKLKEPWYEIGSIQKGTGVVYA